MGQITPELFEKLKRDKRYKNLTPEYRKLLEDYAYYMDREQLAYRTIQRGFYMIKRFLAFLENILVYQISTASTDIINTFLSTMAREPNRFERKNSSSFMADYYIHVKKLFKFLYNEKRILVDPTYKIPNSPYKENALPRNVLTLEEIQKILAQPDTKTLTGIRDKAILELLYGGGLRQMEIRKLSMDDVDLKNGLIHIHESKGAKDRMVPIGKTAIVWLGRYLNLRRGIRPDLKEIFMN